MNEIRQLFISCCFFKIWDAVNGVPIANYRGHGDKVLCCMFSNLDRNKVYSGGEDYALHVWCVDQQVHKTPPEECKIYWISFSTNLCLSVSQNEPSDYILNY
jgi:WD40 repeat protein